jgi:hypothetical protein
VVLATSGQYLDKLIYVGYNLFMGLFNAFLFLHNLEEHLKEACKNLFYSKLPLGDINSEDTKSLSFSADKSSQVNSMNSDSEVNNSNSPSNESTVPSNESTVPSNESTVSTNVVSIPSNVASVPSNVAPVPANVSSLSTNESSGPNPAIPSTNEEPCTSDGLHIQNGKIVNENPDFLRPARFLLPPHEHDLSEQ